MTYIQPITIPAIHHTQPDMPPAADAGLIAACELWHEMQKDSESYLESLEARIAATQAQTIAGLQAKLGTLLALGWTVEDPLVESLLSDLMNMRRA